MNILVFDIETVPDTISGARLYDLAGLSDEDVARAMSTRQMQKTQSDFLPLHQHRVVAISAVLRQGEKVRVWSLGDAEASEAELLRRFYEGLERYTPTLVSWNGGGFDLPVLHYRSLVHGISAHRYWEVGDEERGFRYNNYFNRYHWRHIDLMDVLAGFNPRANAPLTEIAVMLGFPGKLGMSGGDVWEAWQRGEIGRIRDYCETDVLNTFLVFLRFELVRGRLDDEGFARECELLRTSLEKQVQAGGEAQAHLREFLDAWAAAEPATANQ